MLLVGKGGVIMNKTEKEHIVNLDNTKIILQ